MDPAKIRAAIDPIIRGTENLDFPFLSSIEQKRAVVKARRSQIDAELDGLLRREGVSIPALEPMRPSLWREADAAARAEFGALSEKALLNGFYLQEVMHRYAELQRDLILTRMVPETREGGRHDAS